MLFENANKLDLWVILVFASSYFLFSISLNVSISTKWILVFKVSSFILLYSFPKQYHLCFWFQLLISKPGWLSDLLSICLNIFTLLSSRDLKFSMYKILLVILTAPKCCSSISVPFCMAWNHYFFTWANQKYMSCFLSYIQLITRSHKSIDFTFSLRTFRPTFLPGVLSFSHYFNTGIPFWAMDSFS